MLPKIFPLACGLAVVFTLAACQDVKQALESADQKLSTWAGTGREATVQAPVSSPEVEDAIALWDAGHHREAVEKLRQPAEDGYPDAQFLLGLASYTGRGVPRDPGAAMPWLRKAARQGHLEATHLLGLATFQGIGVTRDPMEAAALFRRAAEAGHAGARYQLGAMLLRGDGVPQSAKEGLRWLELAAGQGHPEAQVVIGTAYSTGQGVAREPAWAARWLGMAARQGMADAQYRLAAHWIAGEGLPRDPVRGYAWLLRAQANGHVQAEAMRKALGKRLNASQISQARRLAPGLEVQASRGDHDPATVTFVQYALARSGFDPGAADGLWGEKTRQALVAWQKAQDLEPDGMIGPKVLEAARRSLSSS